MCARYYNHIKLAADRFKWASARLSYPYNIYNVIYFLLFSSGGLYITLDTLYAVFFCIIIAYG